MVTDLGRALATGPISREAAEAAAPWIAASGPEDLVAAVDALVSEGIPFDRLKPAVSRLINLMSKPLSAVDFAPADPFFRSLRLENEALRTALAALKAPISALAAARTAAGGQAAPGGPAAMPAVARAAAAEASAIAGAAAEIAEGIAALSGIEAHYRKKENVLFPHVEARFPRYRCISLMWALHDDVRRGLKEAVAAARSAEESARAAERGVLMPGETLERLNAVLGRLFFDAGAVAFREEKALFPVVAPLFGPAELAALYRESREYGFPLLRADQVEALDAEASALASAAAAPRPTLRAGPDDPRSAEPALALDAGSLSRELVDLILRSLPLDLTFVDAQDRVRYFSNGAERVFPRSPSIIGREVRNCHPAASVGRVMAILESFREGRRNREEFWLETGGRFVRIEYLALRDSNGAYLGALELSQDLTRARSLSGEKRLAGDTPPGP